MPATQTKLSVKDVMTRNPVCVDRAHTLGELARLFDSNEISGAPVVDTAGKLIGVVSRTDILRRALEGPLGSRPGSFFEVLAEGLASGTDLDPEEMGTVEDFMSPEPITARPEDPIRKVAHTMASEGVHRVIVTDQSNTPIGIVTALDLLKVFP